MNRDEPRWATAQYTLRTDGEYVFNRTSVNKTQYQHVNPERGHLCVKPWARGDATGVDGNGVMQAVDRFYTITIHDQIEGASLERGIFRPVSH